MNKGKGQWAPSSGVKRGNEIILREQTTNRKRATTGALLVALAAITVGEACGGGGGAGGSGAGGGSTSATTGTGGSGGAFDITMCTSQGAVACRSCCETASSLAWERFHDDCLECEACSGVCTCGAMNQSTACYDCEEAVGKAGTCNASADQKCAQDPICVAEQQCKTACPPDCRNCYDLIANINVGLPVCPGSETLRDAYDLCVCTWPYFTASSVPMGCTELCGNGDGGCPSPYADPGCGPCISNYCSSQMDDCNNDPG